ncbi:MAG TPA: outer membrane beta-barrel domain-containing protein [Anaeromyxobacter sp.]|nr:outer membrane beta-barrel domain-containing protein [Anaeromyxobacter sp.]
MRFRVAIACFVAVASPALGAEEQPGLDLSEPPNKDAAKGDDDELPPLDLSKPPEPPRDAKPAAAPREEKPRAFQPFSEKDVALGDKVKAVQRKGFLKRGRFELAPVFAATVNDAFYEKFGFGVRAAYNLHDAFAIALRGQRYWKYNTDNVRAGKLAFQSQLLNADIQQQLMLDGVWSPIYGKAAVLAGSIVHFDLFLSAGLGYVWTATSDPPLEQGMDPIVSPPLEWPPLFGDKKPAKLATDLGGGVRFYPKEWLAFEIGLIATFYSDQPAPLLPATIQKVFAANVGVSFFFPTTFDYVYP